MDYYIVWTPGSRSQEGCKVESSWGRISFIPLVWSLWEQEVHHRDSRKGSPREKYNVVLTSSSSFLPVHGTGPQHSMPKPWDTETLTGSNCGVTTCSLFPPEKCWREQVQDHVRSAAFCRAGKQENCQGGGSSPPNRVVTALYFGYHSLSHAAGIALLPILYLLIHNWKLLVQLVTNGRNKPKYVLISTAQEDSLLTRTD